MLANYFGVTTEDHLHTRGEYNEFSFASPFCVGSPPHTWRILEFLLSPLLEVRITSTHVENTIFVRCKGFNYWDHLHTRGEYAFFLYHTHNTLGSPPHTWRIQSLVRLAFNFVKDHLHTRGEYYFSKLHVFLPSGSPPHTWRIHHFSAMISPIRRITSTHVENTLKWINLIQEI